MVGVFAYIFQVCTQCQEEAYLEGLFCIPLCFPPALIHF